MAKKVRELDANGYRKFGILDKLSYATMLMILFGTTITFLTVLPSN